MSAKMIEVNQKLNNPTIEVTRSLFRDRNGYWAKEWEDVDNVYIEFSDTSTYEIAPEEFKTLNRYQQEKVRHAPSSPRP